MIDVLIAKIDELQENGSGWSLHEIDSLGVAFNKFVRFSGSSHLKLPKSIKNKKAVINVKNNDNECFKWAILSALHPAKIHPERVAKYQKFKDELKFDGIDFPVKLKDIETFEHLNTNISVNVYIIQNEYSVFTGKNEDIVVPIRLTENVRQRHIHFLLVTEQDENSLIDSGTSGYEPNNSLSSNIETNIVNGHYMWIKNLSALIQRQVVKKNRHKKHICDRCLHYFYSTQKLNAHMERCCSTNDTKVTLPKEHERWFGFKNYANQIEAPFIIYADIESLLMPIDLTGSCMPPKGAQTKHVPNSIGYYSIVELIHNFQNMIVFLVSTA